MMDYWIIKIEALFEYTPDAVKSPKENVECFLSDIHYQGEGTEKKYDYKVLEDGTLEIGIELTVDWLSHEYNEDAVRAEFMESFEHSGELIKLDYDIKPKPGKPDITYSVEYLMYEKNADGSWKTEPMVCCLNAYENIDTIKAETTEVIAKTLTSHKTPDGEIMVEATITLCGEYVDKDDFVVTFENGKVVSVDNV